jgi:hypothetical protein
MHEYPKHLDRDYSDELMLNLDPTLWDGTLYNKEQLMSIIGIYAMRMGSISQNDEWVNEIDSIHEYSQNMYGYRDHEYTGPADILAAGCSQTFGQGVHLNGRWSNILADKLDMSVATIAVPGWSTQSSISSVMHYIKRFGKPKIVALLLPDFFRFDTMINANYCIPERDPVEPGKPVRLTHASRNDPNPNTPKYAKKPYPLDKILNTEAAFFASGQALAHFVEYCKEAGIALVWGTWEFRLDYLVRYIKNLEITDRDIEFMSNFTWGPDALPKIQLDEYIDMEFYHHEKGTVEEFAAMSCHQELRDEYGDCCFDRGTDNQDHMGVHMHAHIAEKFYDRLVELGQG